MAYKQYVFRWIATADGKAVEWRINRQSLPNTNADDGGDPAALDNLDFYQSTATDTVYVNEKVFTKNCSPITKKLSRENAMITPDTREFEMQDWTRYTGTLGDGTTVDHDLSGSAVGSLLDEIFDDPKACATIFCAEIKTATAGVYSSLASYVTDDIVSYNNDVWQATGSVSGVTPSDTVPDWRRARHLYFIGDIDPRYTTKQHTLVHRERTTSAEQKQILRVKAEPAATRMKRKTIEDFVNAVATDGSLTTASAFYGGYMLKKGQAFDGNGGIDLQPGGLSTLNIKDNGQLAGYPRRDGLHFASFSYLISIACGMLNYTCDTATDLTTGFKAYIRNEDETDPAHKDQRVALTSPFGELGVCYEVVFGIDPRISILTQYTSPVSFDWNSSVSEFIKRVCFTFGCYLAIEYDQTNMRQRLRLLDRRTTGNALPASWTLTKSAERERLILGEHVEVSNTGDSDKVACPSEKGDAISIETGWRARNVAGNARVTRRDITYDGGLELGDQYQCWQLFTNPILSGSDGAFTAIPAWSAVTTYAAGDYVRSGGHTWCALAPSTNVTPPTGVVGTSIWAHKNADAIFTSNTSNFYSLILENSSWIFVGTTKYFIESLVDAHSVRVFLPGGTSPTTGSSLAFVTGVQMTATDGAVGSVLGYDVLQSGTIQGSTVPFAVGQTLLLPDFGIFTVSDVDGSGRAVLNATVTDTDTTGITVYIIDSEVVSTGWVGGSFMYYARVPSSNDYFDSAWDSKSLYDTDSTTWFGAYAVNFWEYQGGSYPIGGYWRRYTDNTVYSPAQFYASELLGNTSQLERTYIGLRGSTGYLTDVQLLDYWTEHINGDTRTFRIIELQQDEIRGLTTATGVEVTETLSAAIIDSKYPVVKVGSGSSGSAGSAGSVGGSPGGRSGSTVTGFVKTAPASSSENTVVPVNAGVTPLTLKGIADQAVDMLSVQDSTGATLASIDKDGKGVFTGLQDTAISTGVVHSDASGNLTSSAVDLNSADVTGVVQEAHGGTGESTYTDGQLLIGNTSSGGLDKATLTAGTGITITNGAGAITIASSGSSTVNHDATLTGDGSIGTPLGIDLTHANTWTGAQTVQKDAIAAVSTNGLSLDNTTTATSGTQVQRSPELSFTGSTWNTSSISASAVSGKIGLLPINGNTATVGSKFSFSFAGTEKAYIRQSGALSLGGATANGANQAPSIAMGSGCSATGGGSVVTGVNSSATGDYAVAMGESLAAAGSHSVSFGYACTANGNPQLAIGQFNTIIPSSPNTSSISLTDPAVICGNGNNTTQAARSYSWYLTFDAGLRLGGRKTVSDATGTQSKTGYIEFGFANNTTVAKVTSASHAATRTYTLDDIGADASFVMTAGTQTVAGDKTFSGQLIHSGGHQLHLIAAKTANYAILNSDYVVPFDCTSGALTATLPTSPVHGHLLLITKKDSSANQLTISGGTFTDGDTNVKLSMQGAVLSVVYDSNTSKWEKVASSQIDVSKLRRHTGGLIVDGEMLIGSGATGGFEVATITDGDYLTKILGTGSVRLDTNMITGTNLLGAGSAVIPSVGVPGSATAVRCQATARSLGGTPGFLTASYNAGTDTLTVASSSATDTSTIDWMITWL